MDIHPKSFFEIKTQRGLRYDRDFLKSQKVHIKFQKTWPFFDKLWIWASYKQSQKKTIDMPKKVFSQSFTKIDWVDMKLLRLLGPS